MRSTRGTSRMRCVATSASRLRRRPRRSHPRPPVRVRGGHVPARLTRRYHIDHRPDVRIASSVGASSFVARGG